MKLFPVNKYGISAGDDPLTWAFITIILAIVVLFIWLWKRQ